MAGDRVLLIFGDVVVAHAGEEIVRMVVLAHVIEAEPPIFVARAAAPWARDGSPAPLQPGHSQVGLSARSRRSLSGLTRMRSNRGESFFMTDHYAGAAQLPSSLDKDDCALSALRRAGLTAAIGSRYADSHGNPRSHHGQVDQGFRARKASTWSTNPICMPAMPATGRAGKPISGSISCRKPSAGRAGSSATA